MVPKPFIFDSPKITVAFPKAVIRVFTKLHSTRKWIQFNSSSSSGQSLFMNDKRSIDEAMDHTSSFTCWQSSCLFLFKLKRRSTASAQLSAYAHWLETHRQTPLTGNDSYSSMRAQTNGRADRQPNATKCIISLASRSITMYSMDAEINLMKCHFRYSDGKRVSHYDQTATTVNVPIIKPAAINMINHNVNAHPIFKTPTGN